MSNHLNEATVISRTQTWLERAVIGLNLCPFAKAVHAKKQIRYVVSEASTHEGLLHDLMIELEALAEISPEKVDTTLIIHPCVLTDFLEYNDFLGVVDEALVDMELDDAIQVASFHPQYQFADTQPGDIENYTNRSPYPMLQLLRESSMVRAVEAYPQAEQIFEKNIETLRRMGHTGWEALGLQPPGEKR